jgi:hypothetical protein
VGGGTFRRCSPKRASSGRSRRLTEILARLILSHQSARFAPRHRISSGARSERQSRKNGCDGTRRKSHRPSSSALAPHSTSSLARNRALRDGHRRLAWNGFIGFGRSRDDCSAGTRRPASSFFGTRVAGSSVGGFKGIHRERFDQPRATACYARLPLVQRVRARPQRSGDWASRTDENEGVGRLSPRVHFATVRPSAGLVLTTHRGN